MKKISYNNAFENMVNVFKIRIYAGIFSVLFATIFFIYSYLLTNSAMGILDFGGDYIYFDVISSAVISFLISLIITLNIYAYKLKSKTSKKMTIGSILSAVLPSSLCCTSIIPSLMAVAGFSTLFIVRNTGKIQSIFSVYGPAFIGIGAVTAFVGLIQINKNINSSCAVKSPPKNDECYKRANEN
jgi:hypothetical protein